MRIEYQGTIEAQPQYQHVGYAAAAVMGSERSASHVGDALGIGLAAFALAMALASARYRRSRWIGVATAGIAVLLGAAAGLTMATQSGRVVHRMVPQFAATLLDTEGLLAATDAMGQRLGRAPTEEEWQAAFGDRRDAWGKPYSYQGPRGWRSSFVDGRAYDIVSAKGQDRLLYFQGALAYENVIISTWLGRDGTAGTADDYPLLTRELQRCGVQSHAGLEQVAGVKELAPQPTGG